MREDGRITCSRYILLSLKSQKVNFQLVREKIPPWQVKYPHITAGQTNYGAAH